MNSLLLTTIHELSDDFLALWNQLGLDYMIVVGDKKTPSLQLEENHVFLNFENHTNLGFSIAEKLPANHYARKNLGYLLALKNKDAFIFETDDDNFLDKNVNQQSIFNNSNATELVNHDGCENVYKHFTSEEIWPRGYPSRLIKTKNKGVLSSVSSEDLNIGIWQGLVNNDPDVDAIFRMTKDTGTSFEKDKTVVLNQRCYCPFNSQSTLWRREFLPYAYLPSTVSVRYTDILRGYVAQRCIWQHSALLAFTSPNLIQFRNDHNLLVDLRHELEMYETVDQLIESLNNCNLTENKGKNLLTIYEELAKQGIVKDSEIAIVEAWVSDINKLL